jgi:D-glycero-alpha-D-manno-heptose-7-phosphate kinase
MILTKTPFRIPFAGGLTDLKPYAHAYGGVTVSATIDKYLYVGLKPNVDGYINLKYMDVHEKVATLDGVRHPLAREAMRLLELQDEPLDIYIMTDLNSESGLGSSGAVAVGLLHAMHAYIGETVTREQLLDEAAHIEVDILEGASGYHDPSICALGGLRLIEYNQTGVTHRAINLDNGFRERFQETLLFFYGGVHHKSKPSLDILHAGIQEARPVLDDMKALAYELERAFRSEDMLEIAKHMHAQQELKQKLPGKFEDQYVIDIVSRVRKHGAYCQLPGGKIGAFVMVMCPDGQQDAIREELSDMREVHFGFDFIGTQLHEV